jgi:pathogenesis-related protein 1
VHDAVLHPTYGWTAEQVHYHYATNTCDGGATCGHYTQVVWRATQKLGCAIGSCPGLAYPSTIVCDYGPGGNINNEKPY